MPHGFLDIATTPSVRAVQIKIGSASRFQLDSNGQCELDKLTPNEAAFIAQRDSFYMATVSETGWPYVQHRGGPAGFLKVLDDQHLAFADLSGNRQYISVGNLAADNRAALILVDYAARGRLKLYVRIEALPLDADPALTELAVSSAYRAKPERILLLHLAAFDWNCPQHITPRVAEVHTINAPRPLHDRLAECEAENASLRRQLAAMKND